MYIYIYISIYMYYIYIYICIYVERERERVTCLPSEGKAHLIPNIPTKIIPTKIR